MQLIVTTNWDEKFLDGLDSNVVEWVSGRLPRDPVGGSSITPENMLKRINRKGVESYIKKVHRRKMKFNYLLDGHCTGNKEYGWYGADAMLKMVKWISDSGADGLTVVIPHLVQVVKKDYPHLKIGFGGSRVIWEMTRVKYYDQEGVDWIILHGTTNRNFKLLRAIRNVVRCDLWLVANSGCLLFCNFGYDHDNYLAHASNYTADFVYTDYFNLHCDKTRCEKPEEFIKGPWIRPEDLSVYENCGYNKFLIYPNTNQTDQMLAVINSYKNRSFDGNLLELLSAIGRKICQTKKGSFAKGVPFLNNKNLSGILDFFIKTNIDCSRSLCSECGYCKKVAKKAVVFPNTKHRKVLMEQYERAIARIEDGK